MKARMRARSSLTRGPTSKSMADASRDRYDESNESSSGPSMSPVQRSARPSRPAAAAGEWLAHRSLDQLDLNLFRVFDVVFRERNLRRAAAILSVTRSAVSHALTRLRGQLGDPLFTRQGRGIVPTAVA